MRRLSRSQLIIIGTTGFVVVFFALLFLGLIPGLNVTQRTQPQPVSLTIWGVDPERAYAPIITAYREQFGNVTISYRQFDERTYEQQLLNALAAGKGPDIFALHNTWVPKHFDKFAPITETQLAFATFQNAYPNVVRQDFAPDRIIYALPLYIDTLATIYNRDILDRNAIVTPPITWADFQRIIPSLVQKKQNGEITQAAGAIGGTTKTISNAPDLLSLVLMQYDAELPAFNSPAGRQALTFYTQFANPDASVYTWNDNQRNAVDSFANGETTILFAYHEAEKAAKAKNAFLPIGVAPMLQISPQNPISYARYYGLSVSNQSAVPEWAWHFIQFLTTNPQQARAYAQAMDRLPALRTLIGEYLNKPGFETYAKQALTARSWRQANNVEIEKIFSNMISRVITNEQPVDTSLRQGAEEVSALIKNE